MVMQCWADTLPAIQDKYVGAVYQLGAGELHIDAPNDAFTEGVKRTVWMDGRKHPGPHQLFFNGHSIGWYENGDTLVVDTTNFTNKTQFQGSSANLHVVERFTRTDADTIDYRFTVDNPAMYSQTWTAMLPLKKAPGPILEIGRAHV